MTQLESRSPDRAPRPATGPTDDDDPGAAGRPKVERLEVERLEVAPVRADPAEADVDPADVEPAGTDPVEVEDDDHAAEGDIDRRGSHATGSGQGFGWVLAWTIGGALVPGAGLLAAGRRRIGGAVLAVLGLLVLGAGGYLLVGDARKRGVGLAVDPQALLLVAVLTATIALLWVCVIVVTHLELRRFADLTTTQRVFSAVVVVALMAGVGLPAFRIGDYALIQRDLVNALFTDAAMDPAITTVRPAATTPNQDPWAGQPRVNVLLVGSDAGEGRIGTRPDTLIVASIDTVSGDTVLFSLPRNLERVPFPLGTAGARAWPNGFDCGDACLLNAVWTWAEDSGVYGGRHAGLEATQDAVEGVTGLKIDTYVMVNLRGFAKFINAIGGIRVNVNERLPIGGTSDHPEWTTGYIEKGKNKKLFGREALWFARSRWSTNDYDRMRRQRCVIAAVVEQADPVNMALAFPAIAKAAKDNISTGIPQRDLEAWVELSQRVQGASVRSLPFTDEVISSRADPDYRQIRSLVKKALVPPVEVTATVIPTPSASASASTGTAAGGPDRPRKKPRTDPSKPQDVAEVC